MMMKKIIIFSFVIICFVFGLSFFALAQDKNPVGGVCCSDNDCESGLTCGCSPNSQTCKITGSGSSKTATGKYGICKDDKDLNTIVLCPTGPSSIEEIIQNIINKIFSVSLIVIPLLILYASFLIMTAGGEPEKIRKGRTIIIMAAIGLAVILSAKVLYGILVDIIVGKP